MNDIDVIRIARQIDRLNRKITELVREIQDSDHPNAEYIVQDLWDNTFDNPAWATHVVFDGLSFPEKWIRDDNGIRRRKKSDKE